MEGGGGALDIESSAKLLKTIYLKNLFEQKILGGERKWGDQVLL